MSSNRVARAVHIGLLADEPIRLAGLFTIFEQPQHHSQPRLIPVSGNLEQLLATHLLEYLVLDLQSSAGGFDMLDLVRRTRPDVRLIVIGPEGNDEMVISAIMAGARAYLDSTAGPEAIQSAIEVVTEGSIWAPRRLLSKLIDRLLNGRDASLANPSLTTREQQVLELILMARSNREIAEQLGIEERTVKAYVGRLMRKTGADNRIKLSMSALSRSLLSQETAKSEKSPAKHGKSR
jgi:DNA-binding NarL/FixJ family response regulator